jgi:3-hydroxyacyl-CoA dehydrogenase
MGAGIALVAAQNGFEVSIFEASEKAREKAKAYFTRKLAGPTPPLHWVERGLGGEVANCDLIIEAIPEQEPEKSFILRAVMRLLKSTYQKDMELNLMLIFVKMN